ncbi:Flp pilus assembly protein CpaB [Thalassobacillus sp. C254]|uniref:Flp pilus assembly protein CpaB n=1 Tax=Thalassobacillus sp. C254 TaxID=1225341 RepID=UPI0006D1A306|nr:Flp pilus assembly protein CpaB [Thalassobacillus sp. C254]
MKPKKLVVLALLSGIITTIMFYIVINMESVDTAAQSTEMVEVIVANKDIEKNEQITEDSITYKELPEDQVHTQAVKDPDILIGNFTSDSMKEGEVIMLHRMYQEGEESEFISKKVGDGNRAISIGVDYVRSVSNLIQPEDIVDVVVSIDEDPVQTEVVIEKVRVLAVGERMIEPGNEEGEDQEYHAVTLELAPEESVEVINASERGTLQLALHSKLLQDEENEDKEDKKEKGSGEAVGRWFTTMPSSSMIRSGPSLNRFDHYNSGRRHHSCFSGRRRRGQ